MEVFSKTRVAAHARQAALAAHQGMPARNPHIEHSHAAEFWDAEYKAAYAELAGVFSEASI